MRRGLYLYVAIGFLGVQHVLYAEESGLPVQGAHPIACERVVLQMHWRHQFQFAGYYIAQKKGYYRESGFDVAFREAVAGSDSVGEVVAGRADFGVCDTRLLVDCLRGEPVVVLAAVLQHSPFMVLVPKQTGIHSLKDLAGKRVMMAADRPGFEVETMFLSQGVSLSEIETAPYDQTLGSLIDGRVDACVGYMTDEPYILQMRRVPYEAFIPREFNVDAYGELLVTSRQRARAQPERVQAFRDASMRGWAYAVTHVDEAIDLIIESYASDADRDELEYEARTLRGLIASDLVELGHVSPERWRNMMRRFAMTLGLSPASVSAEKADTFLFTEFVRHHNRRWVYRLKVVLSAALCVIVFLSVLVWMLGAIVARKTSALAESNRKLEQENRALVEAELMLGLQRDFAAAMSESSTLQSCLDRATSLVLRIAGIDCSGVYLADPMEGKLKLATCRGVSDAFAKKFAIHDASIPGSAEILKGQHVCVNGNDMPKVNCDSALMEEGVTAFLIAPVKYGSEVIASLAIASHTVTDFPANTMSGLESLAMLMGGAISRLKAKEQLSQNEERFRMMIEHAGVSMMVVNASGDVIFDNVLPSVACNGVQDCQERRSIEAAFAKECGKRHQNQIRRVLEKSETIEFVSRFQIDNEHLCFEVTMRPLTLPSQSARLVLIMTKDVSERWRTWEALQESEANFLNLAENNLDVIAIIDRKGMFTYVNRQFEILTGYAADEVCLSPYIFRDLMKPSQWGLAQARLEALMKETAVSSRYEMDVRDKAGKLISVELSVSRSVWHNEPCVFVSARDISERREAERLLKEREALFKAVADGAFDALTLSDVEGRYLFCNTRMTQLTGYSSSELLGSRFELVLDASKIPACVERFEKRVAGLSVPDIYETVMRRKGGGSFAVEVSIKATEWLGRRAFLCVYKDISERKRLELEILKIDEWERARIGQDLHDSIGQQLVGMAYLSEALWRGLQNERLEHAGTASQVTVICRTAHQQLREIVRGLLPLSVDESLRDGLLRLCENVRSRMNVACELHDACGATLLDPMGENHLYQIAQEAVANAVRHGGAKKIVITLKNDDDTGYLKIDDDGCGFDVEGIRPEGSGLKIMKYRADILNGKLSVNKRDTGGISVKCHFMVSASQEERERKRRKNDSVQG